MEWQGFSLKSIISLLPFYAAYNNLMIVNLRFFDPTTYLILSKTDYDYSCMPICPSTTSLARPEEGSRRHYVAERLVQLHLLSKSMLKVLAVEGCRVLEIDGRAGAFSISLLRRYDNVHISGVNNSDKLVAISRVAVGRNKTLRCIAHVLAASITSSNLEHEFSEMPPADHQDDERERLAFYQQSLIHTASFYFTLK